MFNDFIGKHVQLNNSLLYGHGINCNDIHETWPWNLGQGQRLRSFQT